MFANKLSEIITRNRSKHIYITDTLLRYAMKNYPSKKVLMASKLSYCVEHAYWCMDDLIDMEFQKKEKYWTLFSQLWFMRLFHNNLLDLDITIEKKKEILNKIISVEKELWLLAEREEEAKQMAKKDIEKAIYSVLYGKSFHAKIYVTIFNTILDTQKFETYIPYRMLELLLKDFTSQDIEEDTKYKNISAATLVLHKDKILSSVNKIGKKIYDEIDEPYFKPMAKNILNNITPTLKEFLSNPCSSSPDHVQIQ